MGNYSNYSEYQKYFTHIISNQDIENKNFFLDRILLLKGNDNDIKELRQMHSYLFRDCCIDFLDYHNFDRCINSNLVIKNWNI